MLNDLDTQDAAAAAAPILFVDTDRWHCNAQRLLSGCKCQIVDPVENSRCKRCAQLMSTLTFSSDSGVPVAICDALVSLLEENVRTISLECGTRVNGSEVLLNAFSSRIFPHANHLFVGNVKHSWKRVDACITKLRMDCSKAIVWVQGLPVSQTEHLRRQVCVNSSRVWAFPVKANTVLNVGDWKMHRKLKSQFMLLTTKPKARWDSNDHVFVLLDIVRVDPHLYEVCAMSVTWNYSSQRFDVRHIWSLHFCKCEALEHGKSLIGSLGTNVRIHYSCHFYCKEVGELIEQLGWAKLFSDAGVSCCVNLPLKPNRVLSSNSPKSAPMSTGVYIPLPEKSLYCHLHTLFRCNGFQNSMMDCAFSRLLRFYSINLQLMKV